MYISDEDIKVMSELDYLSEVKDYKNVVKLLEKCDKFHFKKYTINLLQIYGIYIPKMSSTIRIHVKPNKRQGTVRFSEFALLIEGKTYRIHAEKKECTPFCLINNSLCLKNYKLDIFCKLITTVGNDRNEGVYFPQLAGELSFKSVRFNPRNLGLCPGGCVFCQRAYFIPTKYEESARYNWSPTELINKLESKYGEEIYPKIEHVLICTELYGNPEAYLNFCEELKYLLFRKGFKGKISALAQEIRTNEQIQHLKNIVDGYDFCYSLECFSRRNKIMSKYKGLSLEYVLDILNIANEVGFKYVRFNYIAGLDSIEELRKGLEFFLVKTKVNAIGVNIFTPYSDRQLKLRYTQGYKLSYYAKLLQILSSYNIEIFRPELYERCPEIFA